MPATVFVSGGMVRSVLTDSRTVRGWFDRGCGFRPVCDSHRIRVVLPLLCVCVLCEFLASGCFAGTYD